MSIVDVNMRKMLAVWDGESSSEDCAAKVKVRERERKRERETRTMMRPILILATSFSLFVGEEGFHGLQRGLGSITLTINRTMHL